MLTVYLEQRQSSETFQQFTLRHDESALTKLFAGQYVDGVELTLAQHDQERSSVQE